MSSKIKKKMQKTAKNGKVIKTDWKNRRKKGSKMKEKGQKEAKTWRKRVKQLLKNHRN